MEESTHRSWGGAASEADVVAERRRERVRRWVRPQSAAVVVGLVVLDIAVVVIASAITGASRARNYQACSSLWADLAHDQTIGLWIVGVLLITTVLLAARWRWVLVATVVVQLVAAAVLVPTILDRRAEFTAVAEGRRSAVDVDSGGAACTALR